jgi:hypothetical protein
MQEEAGGVTTARVSGGGATGGVRARSREAAGCVGGVEGLGVRVWKEFLCCLCMWVGVMWAASGLVRYLHAVCDLGTHMRCIRFSTNSSY